MPSDAGPCAGSILDSRVCPELYLVSTWPCEDRLLATRLMVLMAALSSPLRLDKLCCCRSWSCRIALRRIRVRWSHCPSPRTEWREGSNERLGASEVCRRADPNVSMPWARTAARRGICPSHGQKRPRAARSRRRLPQDTRRPGELRCSGPAPTHRAGGLSPPVALPSA